MLPVTLRSAVFYVLLSTTAYAKLGTSFDPSLPITSVLPPGLASRLINLALLLRCLVACEPWCLLQLGLGGTPAALHADQSAHHLSCKTTSGDAHVNR